VLGRLTAEILTQDLHNTLREVSPDGKAPIAAAGRLMAGPNGTKVQP
jgi:hypothetical protein